MNKIIGLGNALVDVLVKADNDNLLDIIGLPKGSMQLIDATKFIEINEIISQMAPSVATGGSAANTIKALATLGVPVGFIGKIGKDTYGEFFGETFSRNGITPHLLLDDHLNSGVASTFITNDGERTFGTYLGAAANLTPDDISKESYKGYAILYIEGYLVQNHDLILKAVKLAKELGLKVCIDLASYNIVAQDLDFFHYLVENYVDTVFANEEESYAFTHLKDSQAALRAIAEKCEIAVVKVGAKGSCVMKDGIITQVPSRANCKVVDTTGAGDYYAAGFLYGYMHNYNLSICAQLGALLSGHVIEVVGTTLSDETWTEIKNEIKRIVK